MTSKFISRLSQTFQRSKKSAPAGSTDLTVTESKVTLGIGALINGCYRLDEEIGRGGMGIVYRAHDIPNDREVAIKVINFDRANVLTRQQFLHEAEIATTLDHPHIVTVYGTGIININPRDPFPFIVMELVHGMSLDEIHGFTYTRILDIGKQICDALEYAHKQGFVYRDLKPGNVLIEKRGFQYFVKLTDFGLARPRGTANLETESNVAGTLFYLAPELITGQPADIPSDLYALGATLYEMITGRVPFSDFDEQTILSQHLEESVIPPSHSQPDMPPALEAIVMRLLAKNPRDRFASAQEVCQALEQVRLVRESDVAHGNLPGLSSDFVGHENDIVQVQQLLESNQLVTLLGSDEMLAIAIGTQLLNQFSDGVLWVDLGSLGDPALVPETVAASLDLRQDPHRSLTVSMIEHLREKNLLLLLNRCDRLLAACAQLVETILRTCPDVHILVTSHELLGISAEKPYHVVL
jgi:serine/threonine protein kinase